MNRELYKRPFKKDKIPEWECPSCEMGILRLTKGSFHSDLTANSKRGKKDPEYDWEWNEYVYSCMLECPSCKESISSSGTGGVDFEVDHDDDSGQPFQLWYDFFRPKYFQPNLKVFAIPEKTPKKVSENIDESFSMLFANPSSAANHVRISVEEILTSLGVKRYGMSKARKRTFINLHSRIELIPVKHQDLKGLFLAIKFLGNAGSHGGDKITLDDVFDAYVILDDVLNKLYCPKSNAAKKIANRINKKKGLQKR